MMINFEAEDLDRMLTGTAKRKTERSEGILYGLVVMGQGERGILPVEPLRLQAPAI